MQRLTAAVENYLGLLIASRNLDFFTSFYRFMIQLLPAAVVAPLFFQVRPARQPAWEQPGHQRTGAFTLMCPTQCCLAEILCIKHHSLNTIGGRNGEVVRFDVTLCLVPSEGS